MYFILESGEPLVSAMALYRKTGKDTPDSICMKKKI